MEIPSGLMFIHERTTSNLGLAYLFMEIAGTLITLLWSIALHAYTESNEERKYVLPALIGILERAFLMSLVIWIPTSVGPFLATWILVKAVGGWTRFVSAQRNGTSAPIQLSARWRSHNQRERAIYAAGLLGSLMSGMIAVGMGMLASPWWPIPR